MLPFLLVHDPVCFLQNYFRRKFFMFLRHFHDPAAETHCIRFAAVTAELVLHPVDFVPCNAYRTVSQDNAELVSTDSGKNISGFQWGNWTLDLAYAHLWVHSLDYSETDASGIRSSVGNVSTGNSRNTVANIYSATIGYTF